MFHPIFVLRPTGPRELTSLRLSDFSVAAWGIILSSTVNGLPASTPIFYCALFGAGALIMRGAGCIINDMWDQKFDRAVGQSRRPPHPTLFVDGSDRLDLPLRVRLSQSGPSTVLLLLGT